jgi:hypothetical protein
MNVMLLAMFAAIGVGLLGRRFARRETQLVILIAVGMALAYFLRPTYMT